MLTHELIDVLLEAIGEASDKVEIDMGWSQDAEENDDVLDMEERLEQYRQAAKELYKIKETL